jgi:hypothetical protein
MQFAGTARSLTPDLVGREDCVNAVAPESGDATFANFRKSFKDMLRKMNYERNQLQRSGFDCSLFFFWLQMNAST